MTACPIPDNLRDQFLIRATVAWDYAHDPVGPWLDRLTRAGFRIELRLPEFAVHDDTCCELRPIPLGPCPGVGYYHWTTKDPTP